MAIKEELYNQCFIFIENRLLTVKKTMAEIQEALLSETKSSAGDKHETGRAMLQLEREKAGNQLAEIIKIKESFSKINTGKTSEKIGLGSLVFTTSANYYIAISAGILTVGNESFYAISPQTPIGKLLLSKTVGDTVVFRDSNFKIQTIK